MDTQAVNTGSPEVSQPYSIPADMTPEVAGERAKELVADRDFARRLLNGGKDSREARELDALQRRAVGAEPEANGIQPPQPIRQAQAPASVQPAVALTPEEAKARLAELQSDETWREKFFRNDLATRKQFDRLTEIAAQTLDDKAPTETEVREARTAALNAVPEKPEDYGELPFRRDDMPTPEGVAEIQSLMHTAGLTRSEAQTMISFAANDVLKWTQMDDARRELQLADTRERFFKIHGDQAQAMEDGARRLIAEITAKDGGRLREILLTTGAGASLAVWNAVAAAAKRRYRA